jgi:RNA polymerase sigma-70 factor (ECF subfamily)
MQNDSEIVDLFWARSELAISAASGKYSKNCYFIAYNILQSREDAEECASDALARAWDAIPPARPDKLSAFLYKITRNIAFDRYRRRHADKRGSGEIAAALSELEECLPGSASDIDDIIEREVITSVLNTFLGSLTVEQRRVFMRRYWYSDELEYIASGLGITVGKVKSILFRARKKLKIELEKAGIDL